MAKLMIKDMEDRHLAFDLRDVLRALAPESLTAAWTISRPDDWDFEATGSGGKRLEELAETAATIGGHELLALADDAVQVIWGNFDGKLPQNTRESWATVRAVDSSFYEVETDDESVITRLASRFINVRFVDNAL